MDFFGLLPTESFMAYTLSGPLAVNFLLRPGVFYLLVEVYYWLRCFKFVYQTINLASLGITVKIKLPAKFCLHSFEWFCLQISCDTKYFPLLSKAMCEQWLIVVIVYYFQIWNKKKTTLLLVELLAVTWVRCIFRCVL